MKEGKSGMGMHKHGISGHSPHSRKSKMAMEREANRIIKERERLKLFRRGKMLSNIKDLFNAK